jgi:nucleotide-binding universal stress UspA family protein
MDTFATDRRPIVVGVDHSDSARDATAWAADLATVLGAPLHLVHVTPDAAQAGVVPSWLSELRDTVEWLGADVRLVEVVPGATADVLVERAATARLLVLGSYGEGAVAGMLAGSVATDLVAAAPCPVAVVRGRAAGVPPPRSGPEVTGVDGSAAGHAALLLAAGYARALGARLLAVHTWADVAEGPDGGVHRRRVDEMTLADEAGQVLDAELDAVIAAHPGLPVERVLIEDTPLRGLLGRGESARMLVVGHRGHSQVGGMRLGSTSTGLVDFAPCPVVVAKSAPVQDADRAATAATGTTS